MPFIASALQHKAHALPCGADALPRLAKLSAAAAVRRQASPLLCHA
jgi:hypothetical protein